MKKFLIFLIILISCKSKDITPYCVFIQTEKVTTYPLGSDLFYEHNSLPVEERYTKEYCNIKSDLDLQDLLKLLNSKSLDSGICITYHSVIIKSNKK